MTSRIENIIFWFACITLAGLVAAVIVAILNAETLLGLAMITYAPRSPNLPRLMICPACIDKDGKPISTVHHCTPAGEWVCWCGTVVKPDGDSTGTQAEVDQS